MYDDNKVHHVDDQINCYLAPEFKEMEKMEEEAKKSKYKMEIIWKNVVMLIVLHIVALVGVYHAFTEAKWRTLSFMFWITMYAGTSITGGAHRMWSHKAYKIHFRINTLRNFINMLLKNDVIDWARDHRAHHKWSDTDADPHNIKRGFFFAHMGWLMCRKHPKVKEMGSKIDLSDLEADPVLAFQSRFTLKFYIVYIINILKFTIKRLGSCIWTILFCKLSKVLVSNIKMLFVRVINSVSHSFGYHPFDKEITPTDHPVTAFFIFGEGWHNYHHTFPQDYRTSEYMWSMNVTALIIDFFASMGWVWDRKRMSKEAIERQKTVKGDHSRPLSAAHDY
ncbi:hypothetical protein PMAYCL1PPCAC_30620, partial [Pristionchus mayeri]